MPDEIQFNLEFAKEQRRLLEKIGGRLPQVLDFKGRLELVAQAVVPSFADWCIVDLISERKTIKRLTATHGDPNKAHLIEELKRQAPSRYLVQETWKALEEQKAQWIPSIDLTTLQEKIGNPELFRLTKALGIQSMIICPLQGRERSFGSISFIASDREFSKSHFALAQEIAKRVGMSADNARQYEIAQEAIQMREDTLAIVSHDLKNPLSVVQLNTQLLRRLLIPQASKLERFDTVMKSIQNIEQSATQARRLIFDLLDFSKLQAGTFSIEPKSHHTAQVLSPIIEMITPLAHKKRIRIESNNEIPEGSVICDSERITQVLSNIIGNAVKFSPEGSHIWVEVKTLGTQEVLFSVKDNGPGMPKASLSHLFERYWQAEYSSKKGTGLGLFIAKGIVEAHKGRIWVESIIGQGSTFFFTLPLSSTQTSTLQAS